MDNDAPSYDLPVEKKSIKALTLMSIKRTFDLFVGNHSSKISVDDESQKAKIARKVGFTVSLGKIRFGNASMLPHIPCPPHLRPSDSR
jgi:hypothetical protein